MMNSGTKGETVETPRIEALQSLRALAALAVLAAHAVGDIKQMPHGPELLPLHHLGAAGVDLFFVISGFVMVYAGRAVAEEPNGWRIFLARRWARVAPPYWFAMLLYALMQVFREKWHVFQADRILTSAVFWPYRAEDGTMLPFYGIGWTLNFEMFFYGVFALGLLLLGSRAVPFIAAALCALVGAGLLLPLADPLAYWADSIILEFVFGMAIATLYLNGVRLGRLAALLLAAAGLGLIVGGGMLGYLAPLPGEPSHVPRFLAWGLPAAFIVGATILRQPGRLATWPPMQRLGDASYSIYLLHPLPIIMLRPAIAATLDLTASPAGRYLIALLAVALVAALTCAFALLTYRFVEKPINDGVRTLLQTRASRKLART